MYTCQTSTLGCSGSVESATNTKSRCCMEWLRRKFWTKKKTSSAKEKSSEVVQNEYSRNAVTRWTAKLRKKKKKQVVRRVCWTVKAKGFLDGTEIYRPCFWSKEYVPCLEDYMSGFWTTFLLTPKLKNVSSVFSESKLAGGNEFCFSLGFLYKYWKVLWMETKIVAEYSDGRCRHRKSHVKIKKRRAKKV